jgi:4,5-dihydroxyphthalate decarboxylase
MSELRLSLGINEYAHTNALASGRVKPVGIDLNVVNLPFETVMARFAKHLEFDIAEYSLGNYCSRISQPGLAQIIAIPVFTSRAFRLSSIYVREESKILTGADLNGRRVGIPQWSQTATIYVRGDLEHREGVPVTAIDWVQAGLDEVGRTETAKMELPAGIRLVSRPDKTLTEMLLAGEIDAIMSARRPGTVVRGEPGIRRMYQNYRQEEEKAFKETGVFPIMHTIVMRRDVFEANRWIARSLFDAFEEAKRAVIARMADIQFSYLPTAWGADDLEHVHGMLFPGTGFPYGLEEPNRTTLEAFLGYCDEQGITKRKLSIDELFAPEALTEVRI